MDHNDHCDLSLMKIICNLFAKLKIYRNLPIIPRREIISCRNPSRTKLITVKRLRSWTVAMGHNEVRFAPKEMFIAELFSLVCHSNCWLDEATGKCIKLS